MTRQPYPSDVSDEERAFVAPSLTFMTEDAPQRDYSLRPPPFPPPAGGGKGGRAPAPRAVIVDARTMQSPPCPPAGGERGGAARAGYDGHQRPPLSPLHAGGKGGAARFTWLKP